VVSRFSRLRRRRKIAGANHREAENALAQAVDGLFEHGRPLPCHPIERIVLPRAATFWLISSSA